MDYKEKLNHLNLQELACVLGIDLGDIYQIILQKEEMRTAEIPVVIQYGDLCRIASVLWHSNEKLIKATGTILKHSETNEVLDLVSSINHVVKEQSELFEYINNVLCDGNVDRKAVMKIENITDESMN